MESPADWLVINLLILIKEDLPWTHNTLRWFKEHRLLTGAIVCVRSESGVTQLYCFKQISDRRYNIEFQHKFPTTQGAFSLHRVSGPPQTRRISRRTVDPSTPFHSIGCPVRLRHGAFRVAPWIRYSNLSQQATSIPIATLCCILCEYCSEIK